MPVSLPQKMFTLDRSPRTQRKPGVSVRNITKPLVRRIVVITRVIITTHKTLSGRPGVIIAELFIRKRGKANGIQELNQNFAKFSWLKI